MFGSRRPILAIVAALPLALLLTASAGAATGPRFVDPTANLTNAANIHLGALDYVGPFAVLKAGAGADRSIHIGAESNAQDSTVISALGGRVEIGEMGIVAHGGRIYGPAELGEHGTCPAAHPPAAVSHPEAAHCPSFVSFNARIAGGKVEKDAMVSALARVGPGVTIPSGRKVLPGKNVTSNAQVPTKTVPVTEGDRVFMNGVVHVNAEFARGYTDLKIHNPSNVRGINYDPGRTGFNPRRDLPRFEGVRTRDPRYRNRIIGDVRLSDSKAELTARSGRRVSLRADEGEAFGVGSIEELGTGTMFHALEHSDLRLGSRGSYGVRSIVHGGPGGTTTTGAGVTVGDGAVFFASRIGANSTIGAHSFVAASTLPASTEVPPLTVVVGDQVVGTLEWLPGG